MIESNSLGAHYVILQIELDEEKSNPACLAQQNGFWPNILHGLLRLVKAQQSLTPAREECNKYDLTDAPCFWLTKYYDWSTCFAIRGLPPICSPSFSWRLDIKRVGEHESFLAHSLGGLFSRYAIANLYKLNDKSQDEVDISNGSHFQGYSNARNIHCKAKLASLELVNFITIATPILDYGVYVITTFSYCLLF